jgi:hypothetical protein
MSSPTDSRNIGDRVAARAARFVGNNGTALRGLQLAGWGALFSLCAGGIFFAVPGLFFSLVGLVRSLSSWGSIDGRAAALLGVVANAAIIAIGVIQWQYYITYEIDAPIDHVPR